MLKVEIIGLQKEFSLLRLAVYKRIRTEPVDIFVAGLISMDVNGEIHYVPFLKEITTKNDTILKIWTELSPYLNFLNYEILQHILLHFEDEKLQERMDRYTSRIEPFFHNTTLCDFLKCWPIRGSTPPEEELYKFLKTKTTKDWRTCTLHDLDNQKGNLARQLLLPTFSFILEDASRGCVSVTYSFHHSMVAHLQALIRSAKPNVFIEMDIETITVDSVVCYEAPPLLQYAAHLKQLYTSRSPLQPLSDSKHKHLLHFRLARIEKQTLSQGDMDRFTRESLRGDMDDVVYKKTVMESSELGVMADGSWPKVVLIEGAPGSGKTTFAWQQCRQWAEGKLLQAYSIVLLLPLRDNNIRHITSLPDLFPHSKGQVRDEVTRRVVESNGSGCLIWLEGWDELVEDLRSNSLFTQLVQGLQLPAATIYITSRLWATGGLLEQMGDRISQCTELLPLAKEEVVGQIVSMAEEAADDSDPDFVKYLKFNPVIRAAMYTPVTAAIVGQVFKCAPHNPPTTVTQLYSAYVLMRLEHYLTQHPKYSDRNMKVRTLGDLPEGVFAEFWRLCALAYEGVSQQMIVFSSLPEGVSTLGLLQSVPPVYGEGEDQVSYNFLHYTVQEYLAALHLSHLPPQEQMTVIDTKFLNTKRSSHCKTTQFKMVFQFLAGITKLVSYPLSKLLRHNAVTMYNWLYESQNKQLLTSGSSKIRYVRLTYSASLTDYFVAGYCLAHSNNTCRVNFSNIAVSDIAMEFFSKGCNHQLPGTGISSGIVAASFSGGSITADGVKHFLNIPDSMLRAIQHLDLSENKLDGTACEVLAEGVQMMSRLEKLDLSNNSFIGCGGIVKLMSRLHSSKLKELNIDGLNNGNMARQTSGMSSADIGEGASDSRFRCASDNNRDRDSHCVSVSGKSGSKLRESNIDGLDTARQRSIMSSADISRFSDNNRDRDSHYSVSVCSKSDDSVPEVQAGKTNSDVGLEKKRIQTRKISESISKGHDSCTKYPNNTGNTPSYDDLEKDFYVSYNTSESSIGDDHLASNTRISDPDFECLASYIHSTTSLQRLNIGGNDISVESIDSLCKALSANSSMRSLDMSLCHLTRQHCQHLGELLRHCKIEELYLRNCNLTSDEVGKVVSGLNDNHTLKRLDLKNNKIRSEGVVAIAKMLKKNRSLNRLDIAECSIGSSGGVKLGAALERNKTLRELWLSGNALGNDGVRGLCVGLENNSSLQELRLHGEDKSKTLTMEGVLYLLKCMEEKNRSLKKLSLSDKFKRDVPVSSLLKSRCNVEWCT